jgi:hypothetical protein
VWCGWVCQAGASSLVCLCAPALTPLPPPRAAPPPPPPSWGEAWSPEEPAPADAGASSQAGADQHAQRAQRALLRPDPRSTLHALAQLLARLTKDHSLAEKVGA